MNGSILTPDGLRDSLDNRRTKIQEALSRATAPAYKSGLFIGAIFISPEHYSRFFKEIRPYCNNVLASTLVTKYKLPFSQIIAAGKIDELLDILSGVQNGK